MSSPGSGKTTTLLQTIKLMNNKYNIGVLEADIDSDVDAKKNSKKVVQILSNYIQVVCVI